MNIANNPKIPPPMGKNRQTTGTIKRIKVIPICPRKIAGPNAVPKKIINGIHRNQWKGNLSFLDELFIISVIHNRNKQSPLSQEHYNCSYANGKCDNQEIV